MALKSTKTDRIGKAPGAASDGAKPGTKHGELTVALREMVAGMQPGDRLPTQEELMRRFVVSDTTVLRSLTDLRGEGRIVRRQGSGTFVADVESSISPSQGTDAPAATRGMVAVLARPSTMPFFAEMIQAVDANLRAHNWTPLLILDLDVARRIERAREHWSRGEVVGAIHIGTDRLEGKGDMPVIMVGETNDDRDFEQVSLDNYEAGRRVGAYLWDLGHRNVAVVKLKPFDADGRERHNGIDGLRVDGLRAEWETRGGVWNTDWQIAHRAMLLPGHERSVDVMRGYFEPIFRATIPPTAVFAAHDEMAAVAIRALGDMGFCVPEDVSVVGFNDTGTLAPYFRPSLTTVRTPCAAFGTLAVHLLLDKLAHPDRRPRSIRLPAEIIVRESTAPPPAAQLTDRHASAPAALSSTSRAPITEGVAVPV